MTTKPAGTGGVVIAHIEALLAERDHVLVAIDGPCASGKTMLAATWTSDLAAGLPGLALQWALIPLAAYWTESLIAKRNH